MSKQGVYDIAIIGGGAAGLTAASFAAQEGLQVVVLERMAQPGQKIALSGGGRCNVLPTEVDAEQYVTDSSKFTVRNILRSWPLEEVRSYLTDELGVVIREDADTGKLTVRGGGEELKKRLLSSIRARKGIVRTDSEITKIRRSKPFELTLGKGGRVNAKRIILACGGFSYPETGSDGSGWDLARASGHEIVPAYPALTSLVGARPSHRNLAGITIDATVTARSPEGEAIARSGFLFTHRGYSGPAVLNTSHIVARARQHRMEAEVFVSWTDHDAEAWRSLLSGGKRTVRGVLIREMPDRLADLLLNELQLHDVRVATLPRDARDMLIRALTQYRLSITRNDGFHAAEVTGGGVPLSELTTKSLESKHVPGVYLCGEMLDVFGPVGGFNFLWAFVTGRCAGSSAASSLSE